MASPQSVMIPGKAGELQGHVWRPTQPPKALVVVFHGYAAHGLYATVKFAAELCCAAGYLVVSGDFCGHGSSPGTPGFVASADALLQDALDIAFFCAELEPDLQRFVLGSSMGGALALRACLAAPLRGLEPFAGAVLLAPMCAVAESAKPPWWQMPVLQVAACVPGLNSVGVLSPKGLAPDRQYADPERRAMCVDDPLTYSGAMCLSTASALLETMAAIETQLSDVETPFLVVHGDADEIVPLSASQTLFQRAKSTDKRLSVYPGMLHAAFCELPPTRAKVEAEILEWLGARLN